MAKKLFLNPKSSLRTRRRFDELLQMLVYLYFYRGEALAGGSDPEGQSYGNNIKNHNRLSQFLKDVSDSDTLKALKIFDDAFLPAVTSKVDAKGNQKEATIGEMCGVWLTILSLMNNDFVIKKPEALWKYYKLADLKRLKAYSISVEQKQEWREASKEEKKKLLNPRTNDWDENSREVWPTANLNWRREIIDKDILRDCVELYEAGIIDKKRTKACTNANKTKMYCEGIKAPNVTDEDVVVDGSLHTDHFIRHADGGADDESNFWLVLANDNLKRGKRDWFEYFKTEHDICLKEYLKENNLSWLTDKGTPKPNMSDIVEPEPFFAPQAVIEIVDDFDPRDPQQVAMFLNVADSFGPYDEEDDGDPEVKKNDAQSA
jgi:DNA-binding ferritin-like protein (Dps family)